MAPSAGRRDEHFSNQLAESRNPPQGGSPACPTRPAYWIVLIAPSGAYDWSWTSDDTGTGTGLTDTWAESSDAGGSWFAYNSSPTQLQVIATAPG